MTRPPRTLAVLAGSVTAVALVGTAALAATTHPMDEMDQAVMSEMHDMMVGGSTVAEMHRWMAEQGIEPGAMHRRHHAGSGMVPGSMHHAPRAR